MLQWEFFFPHIYRKVILYEFFQDFAFKTAKQQSGSQLHNMDGNPQENTMFNYLHKVTHKSHHLSHKYEVKQ